MSLKSIFEAVRKPVVRFFDLEAIAAANNCKKEAEAGFTSVMTRGGPVRARLSPEEARATIERCDQRLAVLYRRNPDQAPKPEV